MGRVRREMQLPLMERGRAEGPAAGAGTQYRWYFSV